MTLRPRAEPSEGARRAGDEGGEEGGLTQAGVCQSVACDGVSARCCRRPGSIQPVSLRAVVMVVLYPPHNWLWGERFRIYCDGRTVSRFRIYCDGRTVSRFRIYCDGRTVSRRVLRPQRIVVVRAVGEVDARELAADLTKRAARIAPDTWRQAWSRRT